MRSCGPRARRLAVAICLAVSLAACSSPAAKPTPSAEPSGGPLAGIRLAVVPAAAAAQEKKYEAAGDTADARLISRLADTPTAYWLATGGPAGVKSRVAGIVGAAAGRSPVFVLYDVPERDCGSYSSGGASSSAQYEAWVAGVADGLGKAPAIVVLEPDAVPQTLPEAGCADFTNGQAAATRYQELAKAVSTLSRDPAVHLYIDAGNAGWIQDIAALADALRQSGIGHAAGFALNVSNFYSTARTISYGMSLSRELGGAHFVIDTSRNGNGYYTPPAGDSEPGWCNPPGRQLGADPTTDTGQPLVDAYLWIKIPGASDGECRGGPPSGAWFAQYALDLVRNSEK